MAETSGKSVIFPSVSKSITVCSLGKVFIKVIAAARESAALDYYTFCFLISDLVFSRFTLDNVACLS